MHRLALREGWSSFFLISLVVLTATWSVQAADWADGLGVLTSVTLLGLLTGLALSQLRRLPALLAHLLSLVVGAVVVLYQVTNFLGDGLGGRREKLSYLWNRWEQWYGAVSQGDRADDLYLFILLMAALLWLLSYTSVWFVFRSHWIWMALLMPGILLLANLGYSLRVPNSLVVLYLFASILLLMRFSFARREADWRSLNVPYPTTLVWRGLWVASYLALAVIVVGWGFPLSARSSYAQGAWQRIDGPWQGLERRFDSMFSNLRGPATGGGGGVGGYASFGDSFQVGGPLRLSNQEVVLVKGDSAPYLVAHRYNVFTGSGWQSDVNGGQSEPTNQTASTLAPLLSFDANQEYPLPGISAGEREASTYEISILSPRGAVVYSGGELGSTSIPTQVQVSWFPYVDQVLDVQEATEESTPPMLWPLVQLLKTADFTPPPPRTSDATPEATAAATPSPTPVRPRRGTPPELPRIREQLRQLNAQSIEVEYAIGSDYRVSTMTFTGRLPVLADVEAIFAQNGIRSSDQYRAVALESRATADQLRGAPQDYPVEITNRYLQVPATATGRTGDLARSIAGDLGNPYDVASAIESYLRSNLRYREDVNVPPRGRDIVDYFLFESKEGYCTYYSSAMVEMLRMLGIPSRVAVGFYPASYDEGAGGYLYRDLNAHAWVEVFFPGFGWIPFEPTAARDPIARYFPPQPVDPNAGDLGSGSGMLPTDDFDPFIDDIPPGFGGTTSTTSQDGPGRVGWAMRIAVPVLLGIVAILAYFWLRGLRGLTPATQLFTKVQRGASWIGLPVRSSMTPYEYASSIAEEIPGSRLHVRYLADLYVRERYGGRPTDSQDMNRARHAWLRLRALILRYLFLDRWRPARLRRDSSNDA